MHVDEVLCQSWPGGELTIFISRMNVEGAELKHAVLRNWSNYFLVFFICIIALTACDG